MKRAAQHFTQFAWYSIFAVVVAMFAAAPVFADVSDKDALSALEATQAGFRVIHNKVSPAVVSIYSRMEVPADNQTEQNPFNFFFGVPTPQRAPQVENASGSGVIIREEGIVLTNSHVVANATNVTVQLPGKEERLPAEVVQSDPRSDLAIVRIKQKGTYPVATLGDASLVQVGDWAIAIGSPFRLNSTMTVGVISATGRELRSPSDDNSYRDLLQTDASINPGNSGGALVNIRGEVVGINFMIYSPGESAGSVGIGFAIPINTYTKKIIDTLITGKVPERGRLGIIVKNLDPAMRDAYGVPDGGIFVDSVMPGGAADKAGVKAEDVITVYNSTKITDVDQFVKLVEETTPGTNATLTIIRNKKEETINTIVGTATTVAKAVLNDQKVGMHVLTITPEIAQQYRLQEQSGVLITNIEQDGPADDCGLQQGDIILRVGAGQTAETVHSAEDFWGALSKNMGTTKNGVILQIRRNNRTGFVTMPKIEDGKAAPKE